MAQLLFSPPRKVSRRRVFSEDTSRDELPAVSVDVSATDEVRRTTPGFLPSGEQCHFDMELTSPLDAAGPSVRNTFANERTFGKRDILVLLRKASVTEKLHKCSEIKAIVDYLVDNLIIECAPHYMPYGPAVDLLSLDSMQRVSLEVSSNDELLCDAHAGSNCANGNGLPQMVIRDFICDKGTIPQRGWLAAFFYLVKEELAKASEDHSETNCEGNSGITASSDQSYEPSTPNRLI